ncbi:hypothetical protein C8255_08660 [filamentous cyanobacterium CCP3]|nr:hypothetical protein C8255_08660 [filamentous cyanobacterium CCP3]
MKDTVIKLPIRYDRKSWVSGLIVGVEKPEVVAQVCLRLSLTADDGVCFTQKGVESQNAGKLDFCEEVIL